MFHNPLFKTVAVFFPSSKGASFSEIDQFFEEYYGKEHVSWSSSYGRGVMNVYTETDEWTITAKLSGREDILHSLSKIYAVRIKDD